jgi:hypothetical protein
MKATLLRVGCMPLLDGDLTCRLPGEDSRNKVSLAFCICFAVIAVTLRKMLL